MRSGVILAEPLDHRLPHPGADRERLVRQHGGLVRDADPLEVAVGVEAGGRLLPEVLGQRLA